MKYGQTNQNRPRGSQPKVTLFILHKPEKTRKGQKIILNGILLNSAAFLQHKRRPGLQLLQPRSGNDAFRPTADQSDEIMQQ